MYVDPTLFFIVVFIAGYIVIQHVVKPLWNKAYKYINGED